MGPEYKNSERTLHLEYPHDGLVLEAILRSFAAELPLGVDFCRSGDQKAATQ